MRASGQHRAVAACILLGLWLAVPAAGQQPGSLEARAAAAAKAAEPFWSYEQDRVRHMPSGVAFPLRAGLLAFDGIGISSHRGTGLDDVVQWTSPDRQSFISAFVFRPTLPDAGLTAAMTDLVVRDGFGVDVKASRQDRPAAGIAGALRIVRYENGRLNGLPVRTAAAFVRVGPWIVALRITAPAARTEEFEAALAALVEGMDYGARYRPRRFHDLALESCGAEKDAGAPRQLPMKVLDAAGFAAVVAGVDSGTAAATRNGEPVADPSRVPDRFCVRIIGTEPKRRSLLLTPRTGSDGTIPVTEMKALLILNDAGTMMELSRAASGKTPYYLLSHGVGEAQLLGAFETPLREEDYVAIVAGRLPRDVEPNRVTYTVDAENRVVVNVPTASDARGGAQPADAR